MRSIIICRYEHARHTRAAAKRLGGRGTRDTAAPKRRLASDDLLAGRDEVIIEHAGQEYHLRHTRAGKLILTK